MRTRVKSYHTLWEVTEGDDKITIGEALEGSTLPVPNKPVDQGDAAAIRAAEVRATGINQTLPGGFAATAQSAATFNARPIADEYKTTLSEVIGVKYCSILCMCLL